MSRSKADILKNLQSDILRLQGFKPAKNASLDMGLAFMQYAFPGGSFPLGAVHEFLSAPEDLTPAGGFVTGLLSYLMRNHGVTLWVSSSRTLFPPGLKSFGLEQDRFIFIDVKKEKDILWVTEEALKCSVLSAVVAEIRDIDFTTSRRLQLAVELSSVTGFIIRKHDQKPNPNACVSRWKITSLPSESDGMPGIGFPKWRVELLKMRNGRPGVWDVQWINGKLQQADVPVYHRSTFAEHDLLPASVGEERKAG